MSGIPLNALLALAAAASWGGGDFCGGMGVKIAAQHSTSRQSTSAGALRLVLVAHAISFAVLFAILALRHASWPDGPALLWGLAGGVAGGISLTSFYVALSRGAMGASAAISGVLAAAIPAVVSTLLEGAPSPLRLAGFAVATAAIWMIAAGPKEEGGRTTLMLAVVGGLGFGVYFVALRMANPLGVLVPMTLARAGSLGTCFLLLLLLRGPDRARLSTLALRWALGVSLLDTGGNLLFIAATRAGRLDVAAVLSSLYPASTILLAAWRLHERPSARQLVGMAVAVAAVAMITL